MLKNFVNRLVKEEEGQGMVEYGLVLAAVVAIGVAIFGGTDLTNAIKDKFATLIGQLTGTKPTL